MALKTKVRARVKPSSSGGAKQPERLTIDQARERFDLGTVERAVAECEEYNAVKNSARELHNAANRAKTATGKALNALVLNETIKRGDKIIVGDTAFFYDYSFSESIPTEKFYKLFKEGKMSEEIFLKCISVSKDKATKLVGAHVLDDITDSTIGNKADVRTENLDKAISEPYKIVKKQPPKPKVTKQQHEPVAPKVGLSRKPVRRKIGVR